MELEFDMVVETSSRRKRLEGMQGWKGLMVLMGGLMAWRNLEKDRPRQKEHRQSLLRSLWQLQKRQIGPR